ncbi:MAG TPA: bifunctional tRNA (5-methylaminomethyl-2-thiouridine)(34)-methyltransferase MnmD/FAD-dependent 5-carboxymethylaminomethyl-2-thiouridine(34) oxidoreductase MnmC [Burkholderiales bacterium]|nr:bifunctional tRNA (5-methylaminomethyl-2-thiouridine)(34)-methyltransferase MnmD/FAD-dependent 5-carboxymethylaminomethyl-2-thiouridine(34) oxidoreductase MnmC [Burkholderiales bacterium]
MPGRVIPAKLDFRDETPYSAAYGDVYHSAAGGPQQAHHVFLGGNDLPGRWRGRKRFVILETGFGPGFNFLTTWHAWRNDTRRCRRLHFVSVEKHPFSLDDLRTLHERYPELSAEAGALHAAWPPLVSGAHRLEFDGVVLTLFFDDVAVLRELRLGADAIYLDGFAPAKNPDMWSHQVMRAVSRLAGPGATLATWSVAAPVRDALAATGFAVEKRAGFAGKREMLVGRYEKQGQTPLSPPRHAAVVGAGIAGAAVCERLCARGWEVDLYERHAEPAQEASGNAAGAFHPVVTPDDSVFARITRAGYLYSLQRWRALAGLRWDPCGLLQLARNEKEARSQEQAAAGLPADYAQFVSAEQASRHAGVPLPASGLWFPGAGWVQPRSLVDAQLAACSVRLRRRFGRDLEALPDAPVVVLANSGDAPKLAAVPHLRLRRVRGQLTYLREGAFDAPHVVVLRGGMVLPPVDGLCVIGASYDIGDDERGLREESHAGNLERLKSILGIEVRTTCEGRVGFRSVAPDRLPVVGKVAPATFAAFAYGSRGLIWAALAAEIVASELEGEPLPLAGKLLEALAPDRFRRRAESRAKPA